MKIFLFGRSGQLGGEIAKVAPLEHVVVAYSSKELPLEASDAVARRLSETQPDLVINAAAYTDVEKAQDDREQAFLVNHTAVKTLARSCQNAHIPLVHFSTDYVFDGDTEEHYREESHPAPLSVYGESKLAGERAIQELCSNHLILRVSWIFSSKGRNFVKTILRLAREKEHLTIVGDQLGRPTSASSIAKLSLSMAEQLVSGTLEPGLYHFGNQPVTSWHDFAQEILLQARGLGMLEDRCSIEPITTQEYPTKAQRPLHSILSCNKLRSACQIDLPDWREELSQVLDQIANPQPS